MRNWTERQYDRLRDALQVVRTLTRAGFDTIPEISREFRSFLDTNWRAASQPDGAGALDTSFLKRGLRRFSSPMPTSVTYKGFFQFVTIWFERVVRCFSFSFFSLVRIIPLHGDHAAMY